MTPSLSPFGLEFYVVEEKYSNDDDDLFSNSKEGRCPLCLFDIITIRGGQWRFLSGGGETVFCCQGRLW